MLVTAVEQLAVMAQERMYAEAANLLQATLTLLTRTRTRTQPQPQPQPQPEP